MSQNKRSSRAKPPSLTTNNSGSPLVVSQANKGKKSSTKDNCLQNSPVVKKDNMGIDWIQCDHCSRWDFQDNAPLKDINSPSQLSTFSYKCNQCVLLENITLLESRLADTEKTLIEYNSLIKALQVSCHSQNESINALNSNSEKTIIELKTEIEQLSKANQSLNSRLSNVEELKTIPSTISAIKKELADEITSSKSTLTPEQIQVASNELEEIKKRKLNLIISGLPEKGTEDLSNFIKFANDYHDLPNELTNLDIINVERIGNNSPNFKFPRLLRIKFSTQLSRRRILLMHRCKKPGLVYPQIFSRPDLTRRQELNDKQLREKWTVMGKDNFKISQGKIVPRSSITDVSNSTSSKEERPTTSSTKTFVNSSFHSSDISKILQRPIVSTSRTNSIHNRPLPSPSPFGQSADDCASVLRNRVTNEPPSSKLLSTPRGPSLSSKPKVPGSEETLFSAKPSLLNPGAPSLEKIYEEDPQLNNTARLNYLPEGPGISNPSVPRSTADIPIKSSGKESEPCLNPTVTHSSVDCVSLSPKIIVPLLTERAMREQSTPTMLTSDSSEFPPLSHTSLSTSKDCSTSSVLDHTNSI